MAFERQGGAALETAGSGAELWWEQKHFLSGPDSGSC